MTGDIIGSVLLFQKYVSTCLPYQPLQVTLLVNLFSRSPLIVFGTAVIHFCFSFQISRWTGKPLSSARCGACLTPTDFFWGTRFSFTRVSVHRCCGLLPRITCALPSCRSAHPPQRCHPCLLLGPSLVLLSSLPLESALHRAARGSYNRGAGCSFSWFSEWSPTSLPWPAGPGLSPSALAALCPSCRFPCLQGPRSCSSQSLCLEGNPGPAGFLLPFRPPGWVLTVSVCGSRQSGPPMPTVGFSSWSRHSEFLCSPPPT